MLERPILRDLSTDFIHKHFVLAAFSKLLVNTSIMLHNSKKID